MHSPKPSVSLIEENTDTISSYQSRGIQNLDDPSITPSANLDFSNNRLTSLNNLPSPAIVKVLRVPHNQIAEIEEFPLKFCTNLAFLDLCDNKISKISNLFYLNRLHSLNLSKNDIEVIENLEGTTNLRQLNISDNNIHSIFVRSPLPKLVSLDVSRNKLRLLHGISAFPCLSTLIVNRNRLSNLSGIRHLLNLRTICATHNNITNFPAFFMPLLTYIDLTSNKLTSLDPFTRFQGLVSLDLSGNPLDDSAFLIEAVFPHLKEFRANSTAIQHISGLASIAPNVVTVSITTSHISSLNDVRNFIANVKGIEYFDIRGNPVNKDLYLEIDSSAPAPTFPEYNSEDEYNQKYPDQLKRRSDYRKTIIGAGNSLVWLDGIKIGNAKKDAGAIPPSKLNFVYVDETAVEIDSETEIGPIVQPTREEIPPSMELPESAIRRSPESSPNKQVQNQNLSQTPSPVKENKRVRKPLKPRSPSPPPPVEFEPEIPTYHDQNYGYVDDGDDFKDSFFDVEDSGPGEADYARRGIGPGPLFDYGPPDMPDDDDWDKYDPGTDDESEIGGSYQPPGQRKMRARVRPAPGAEKWREKPGGCTFYLEVPGQPERRRDSGWKNPHEVYHPGSGKPKPKPQPAKKKTMNSAKALQNRPPFDARARAAQPSSPKKDNTGHYPFNTKAPRRLPWDKDPDDPPTYMPHKKAASGVRRK